jgi:CheY-like chemotaxis protein
MVAAHKRVLVVDDERIVRDSCERVLTDAGYDVHTVATGREALSACRNERFDVMLTDLRMPDMDGLEIAQAMTSEFPEIRVIVITGYPSQESADRAKRLGVFDYLQKPLSAGRLTEATAAVLTHPPRYTSVDFPMVGTDSQTLSTVSPAALEPNETASSAAELDVVDHSAHVDNAAETGVAEIGRVESTATESVTDMRAATGELAGSDDSMDEDISTLKAIGLLAVAPLAGLAFVMFLPLIGFGMLFAVVGARFGLNIDRWGK